MNPEAIPGFRLDAAQPTTPAMVMQRRCHGSAVRRLQGLRGLLDPGQLPLARTHMQSSATARPAAPDPPAENRGGAVRRVLWITLAFNLLLAAAKAFVGIRTGTLSIAAEAAQSSVDGASNLLALVLAGVAARGPDAEHPYGHVKFETLGALGIVAFLSITVFELVSRAWERLAGGGGDPQVSVLTVGVMLGSALVSGGVSVYEARRGRELGSDLLLADAAHTRTDAYAALAVLAGLGAVAAGYPGADPVVTLGVAAMISWTGWEIVRRTVPVLVDQRAVPEAALRQTALATPGVLECTDARSRGVPGEVFVEMTIRVDGALDVRSAHEIADRVENRIAAELAARRVVVHVEPLER